jgi:ABC-2 type transport system permease protein
MMRLFRVELRRLWWRRVTWGACLLAVVVAGITVFSGLGNASPPSAQEIADAERYYAEELEWWEQDGEEQVAQCREDEAADADPAADYGCDQMAPQLEFFLPPTVEYFPDAGAREWFTGVPVEGEPGTDPQVAEIQAGFWHGWGGLPGTVTATWFLLMLALVVGVSFVTAEIGAGSLGMWLTFEPRRRPVYLAKAAAAAVGALPVVLAGWLVVVGGLYAVHAAFGTVGDASAAAWTEVATFTGRLAVAGAAAAAIGVALGILLKHAAAAIGVAVGVLWATAFLGFGTGAAQRWMPVVNLDAWMRGGSTYGFSVVSSDDSGQYTDQWVERAVTQTQGGLYLLALVVVLSLAALLVFRRRDVS